MNDLLEALREAKRESSTLEKSLKQLQKEREKEKAKLTCNPIDSINRNKISSVTFTNTKRFDYKANEDSRPVLEPNYTNIRNKVPVMLFGKGIRFKKTAQTNTNSDTPISPKYFANKKSIPGIKLGKNKRRFESNTNRKNVVLHRSEEASIPKGHNIIRSNIRESVEKPKDNKSNIDKARKGLNVVLESDNSNKRGESIREVDGVLKFKKLTSSPEEIISVLPQPESHQEGVLVVNTECSEKMNSFLIERPILLPRSECSTPQRMHRKFQLEGNTTSTTEIRGKSQEKAKYRYARKGQEFGDRLIDSNIQGKRNIVSSKGYSRAKSNLRRSQSYKGLIEVVGRKMQEVNVQRKSPPHHMNRTGSMPSLPSSAINTQYSHTLDSRKDTGNIYTGESPNQPNKKEVRIQLPESKNTIANENMENNRVSVEEEGDFLCNFMKEKEGWMADVRRWNKENPDARSSGDLSTQPSSATRRPRTMMGGDKNINLRTDIGMGTQNNGNNVNNGNNINNMKTTLHLKNMDDMFKGVEIKTKCGAFTRGSRFDQAKEEAAPEISFPNIDITRNRKLAAVIKKEPELKAPKGQEGLREVDEEREKIKVQYEKEKPVFIDQALRPRVFVHQYKGEDNYISRKHQFLVTRHFLAKKRGYVGRGPGEYNPEFLQVEPRAPAAQIKKIEKATSLSPPRIRKHPGPGHYDPIIDQIHEKVPEAIIGNAIRRKSPVEDRRRPLSVKENLTRPRTNIYGKIQPVGDIIGEEEKIAKDPTEMRRGPGRYSPQYKHTEKRTDLGVLQMFEVGSPKLDKIEEDIRNYDPYLHMDKEPPGVFKYFEDYQGQPPHLPQNLINPEKWQYYSTDLNAVRPDPFPKAVDFARGLGIREFKDAQDDLELLTKKNRKGNLVPAVGEYDARLPPDTRLLVDFSKGLSRDPYYSGYDKELMAEFDNAGDMLILEPEKPKQHLANLNLGKIVGRTDNQDRDELLDYDVGGELILNPDPFINKKRTKMLVNMDKQVGRTEEEVKDALGESKEFYVRNFEYSRIGENNPGEPSSKAYDFGKAPPRFPESPGGELSAEKSELYLQPKYDFISKQGIIQSLNEEL